MYINTFLGFEPYYRPWVEFFGINNEMTLGKDDFNYFNSELENILLKTFSDALGAGGKIFVSYEGDKETTYGLTYGIPTTATRLGNKLYELGFTWFKDWYFPEGGSEGAQRLQGEKPLDGNAKNKHLKKIIKEIKFFNNRIKNTINDTNGEHKEYLIKALKRTELIIDNT
jgi:hypothetical protein